jgi:hypothetical protein
VLLYPLELQLTDVMDAYNIEMSQVDVKLAQETKHQILKELDVLSDKAALVTTKFMTLATDALLAPKEPTPTLGQTNVSLLQPLAQEDRSLSMVDASALQAID